MFDITYTNAFRTADPVMPVPHLGFTPGSCSSVLCSSQLHQMLVLGTPPSCGFLIYVISSRWRSGWRRAKLNEHAETPPKLFLTLTRAQGVRTRRPKQR